MKVSKVTASVGIAALVLASSAPGFTQQGGTACSVEIAQVRAQIWRAQAAMDITQETAAAPQRGKALASAQNPSQGEVSAGRSTMPGQNEVSGAGRSTMPGQNEVSAGRALAAAPGFTPAVGPASGVGRISSTANAQFRVLASDQDRKAFVDNLNDQERRLLYQTLTSTYKKRLASAAGDQKELGQKVSDQDAKAWAEKIATDRTGLSKKIAKARTLARSASDLCKKGDSEGAAAKAKEAMEALK
ncbi:MAG TPA: hypothetical protein VED18_05190 [Candidatus Sulfotelmatobacter sp.]|nr:hypothetical protein [Candidatus Sulfotelmatobacter sp.]